MLPFKKLLKKIISAFGYQVRFLPKALQDNPAFELAMSFDWLLEYQFLRTGIERFYFMQIGANDGVTVDPLNKFINEKRCKGLLIEPQSAIFETLKDVYRDHDQLIFEQICVGNIDGFKDLYSVDPNMPYECLKANMVASFYPDFVLRVLRQSNVPNPERYIVKGELPCMTVQSLCKKHNIERLDLLQMDLEGYDFELLKTIDFETFKPVLINYEHANLSCRDKEACWRFLINKGYKLLIHEPDTTAYYGGFTC